MNYPFVCVINHICFCRALGDEIFIQKNMLADDASNFRIIQTYKKMFPGLCVILVGFYASCLGYIVQQCSRLDKIRIEIFKGIRKEHGYAADLKGMGHDVIHHLHIMHYMITFLPRWYPHMHPSFTGVSHIYIRGCFSTQLTPVSRKLIPGKHFLTDRWRKCETVLAVHRGIPSVMKLLQSQSHVRYHIVISAFCFEEQYIGRCAKKSPGRFLPSRTGVFAG